MKQYLQAGWPANNVKWLKETKALTTLRYIVKCDTRFWVVSCSPVAYSLHVADVIMLGSPFQFTVGPITDVGAHKVRAMGPGLERGEVLVPS